MTTICKQLELSLQLGEHGVARIEYYEPESGDYTWHEFQFEEFDSASWQEAVKKIGGEIYSWFALMADEANE